nr:Telomere length regulation protein domain containing protein [Haemonchus contortus]
MLATSKISQRLDEADERAVILGILADAKQEIQWGKDCSSILEGIIRNINKIVNFLTQNEVSSCVDICFTSANPLHAIPVLVSTLSSPDVVDRIIYWLTLSMREHLDDTLKDSIKTGIDDFLYNTYSEFVTSIVFLREKLLNATNRNKVQFKTPESLRIVEGSLCSALTSSLQHVYDSIIAEKDVDLRVLALLIAKSRTIVVMGTTLLRYVVKWLCSREESAIWDRIAQRIFTDDSIPTRDAEALVIEAALSASKTEDLMRCFGLVIRRNPIVHRVCCTKLFLQRVCEPALVVAMADYLHTAATKDVYVQTIKAAISIWSDVSHVRYVAVEQQMHLTRVILALGRWIDEMNASHVWKELFDIAIKGVELRLGNPDVIIRQSGMFVGEAFSGWMGGERLEFEYTEDPWLEEMRRLRDGATKPTEEITSEEISPSPECVDVQLPSSSSAITETQAVDSDDEEDFPAYEVPESEKQFEVLSEGAEPEKKAPAPYYIRDCYEQLSEKEKYEVFEAAFFALNRMIRRKAIGFNDIAQNLAKKLVFLEDKFSTKNFEDIRKQCLISCLVMRPEIAPKLGDMVFSRSCAFFHRYLILECFVAAAKELSEFPNESATKKVVELPKKNKEQESNDWRAVVEARIRSHTRRFTSEEKPEVVAPSRFAPVATLFFYPLLRTQTEEHLELKGRDSPFLARLIFTVSDILQKAANAPTVVKMAISLADVVAPLKFHPDAFIRSSVLFSYFSIAVAVPDGVFFELFEEQVRGWIEWTTMCADDVDASEQQRNLARAVMTILLQKLNATNTIEESHS